MHPAPDLSVVIPVRNGAATIEEVVSSFVGVVVPSIEVIVVDDASTDDTAARARSLGAPRVRVERLPANVGAGMARNVGFDVVSGRYTLFFDADDVVHPRALTDALTALDNTGADVAFMPYHYQRAASTDHSMNSFDVGVWGAYTAGGNRLVRLAETPRLLGFSNYPWNKIIRTEHYRRTGLRFGRTTVHNDVLGHWLTLLDSRTILLHDDPLCTHIVSDGSHHLTNRESHTRLALIDALDETYDEIEKRPALRNRYSHHYWDFVLRVTGWAATRLTPDVRDEFNLGLQRHLLRMNLADFTRVRRLRDPALATRIVRRALA